MAIIDFMLDWEWFHLGPQLYRKHIRNNKVQFERFQREGQTVKGRWVKCPDPTKEEVKNER